MMEELEGEIKEDINFQQKIKANQPLHQEEKKKEK